MEVNKICQTRQEDSINKCNLWSFGRELTSTPILYRRIVCQNDDLSSQLGFIILLCHASNRAHIPEYSSRKSKRALRSIIEEEIYEFAELVDRALILRHDHEIIYWIKIALVFIERLSSYEDIIFDKHFKYCACRFLKLECDLGPFVTP